MPRKSRFCAAGDWPDFAVLERDSGRVVEGGFDSLQEARARARELNEAAQKDAA